MVQGGLVMAAKPVGGRGRGGCLCVCVCKFSQRHVSSDRYTSLVLCTCKGGNDLAYMCSGECQANTAMILILAMYMVHRSELAV